jgi:hypothetical protein
MPQDCRDWELVISDNCSEDDVGAYVASLDDRRIVYSRLDRPVSVTDNWNRVLSLASGNHFIMLGDDDALRPGYLTRMYALIDEFNQPDLIYTAADLFTYAGVDPEHPVASLMPYGYAGFLLRGPDPYWLSSEEAIRLVRSTMEFVVSYGFNMQFALISRSLEERLDPHGAFFQSEFPDYYAMNACFLTARRILIEPSPHVVIGVTPKSYGYFHANQRAEEGSQFLNADRRRIAPGSHINRGWLDSGEHLEAQFGDQFGITVDRRRYRKLQCRAVYEQYLLGQIDRTGIVEFAQELPPMEHVLFRLATSVKVDPKRVRQALGRMLFWLASSVNVDPKRVRQELGRVLPQPYQQFTFWSPPRSEGNWRNIIEAMDASGARATSEVPYTTDDL